VSLLSAVRTVAAPPSIVVKWGGWFFGWSFMVVFLSCVCVWLVSVLTTLGGARVVLRVKFLLRDSTPLLGSKIRTTYDYKLGRRASGQGPPYIMHAFLCFATLGGARVVFRVEFLLRDSTRLLGATINIKYDYKLERRS